MIQGGQRLAGGARPAPVAGVRRAGLLLLDEIRVGSVLLAAIGLTSLALVLQTYGALGPGHFRPAGGAFFAVALVFATLGSLGLCFAVGLPLRRLLSLRVRQALGIVALISLVILSVLGATKAINGASNSLQGRPYTNDGAVFDLYAAEQVVHGHNPYMKTNIVAALAAIDAPAITVTPLKDGQFRGLQAYPSEAAVQQAFMNDLRLRPRTVPPEFESKYNYPSGSFVFILPFVWAGLHDMRFLYALAILAMCVYLWFRMPRSLRPLVPLLILADVPLMALTAGGQPDPIYGLFLMVGYAEWSSPWLSPVSMGLAVGTKQLAWFFLPFYFVLILHEFGLREALRRSAIIGGVALLMNAPFILWSPGSFLSSISSPMADPMFPLGIGIIALFVSNVLPMLPKAAFALAEAAAWLSGLVASVGIRSLPLVAGPVFAALPLFFAWRSLVNYFYLVPLLALAVVLAEPAQRAARRT